MRIKKLKAVIFKFCGSELITEKLKKMRFSRWSSGGKVVVYTESDHLPVSDVFDKNEWYLTRADCDI